MNAIIRVYFSGKGKGAVLQNVYVPGKYRGQGIAKKLMTAMLAKLEGIEGLEMVGLGVYVTQEAAIELYKSFGFQIVKKETHIMHGDKEFPDQYLMEKAMRP